LVGVCCGDVQVEAEVVDAASIKYEIASVPTFILLKVCSSSRLK
jgi:hypothetical protein